MREKIEKTEYEKGNSRQLGGLRQREGKRKANFLCPVPEPLPPIIPSPLPLQQTKCLLLSSNLEVRF